MANTVLLDGKYTRGFYVGRAVIDWPFKKNGDYSTISITREWRQSATVYFPGKLGVDRDPYYTTAYLNEETEPQPIGIGPVVRTTRTFNIIPTQQVNPSSYLFSAPNFTPINWSSAFTTVPAGSYAIAGAYAIVALASYTPTVDFMTTAACAAITGYYAPALTITSFSGGPPATTLTIPGHNYVATNQILYRRDNGSDPRFYTFVVSSISGDDVIGTSTLRAEFGGAGSGVALYLLTLVFTANSTARKRTKTTPDTGQQVVLPAQVIEDFYLPGVSAGITTAADVPSQQPFQLENYLGAWAAAATWFNVQSSGLDRWHDGPILRRVYTQAKLNP